MVIRLVKPKTQLLIGFEWPRLSPKILVTPMTPAPTTPPLLLIPIPIPIQMTIVLFVSTPMGSTISSTSAMLARLSKPRNRPSLLSHLPEFPCVPFVFLSLCSISYMPQVAPFSNLGGSCLGCFTLFS